ncbi:MAG TPA: DDE-type integrase/transposase/recombinase [Blastocatellia bacterium]|nr:DDE-type integrase/transposase/recombinase [Blastocatellia bacterium]
MNAVVESEDHLSDEGDAGEKVEVRLQAVLALLSGESFAEVQARFKVSRSSLYEYKNRALAAMRAALRDKRRGPRHPHNRLSEEKEGAIRSVCERHPTLSSYQVKEQIGEEATTPRAIQRVRERLHLPRLNKRDAPSFKAHRFTDEEKRLIRKTVESKLHLGPYRLAWDLQNLHGLSISPSTTRRAKRAILDERNPHPAPVAWRFYERKHPHSLWHGDFFEKVTLTDEDRTAYQLTLMDDYSRAYVYCDLLREPTQNDTIRALIVAMRQYRTIPKGVVFDNGPQFKGYLLSAFCSNLGIRLIHSSVYHPQTNGKLERAFRDDRREYYDQFNEWIFNELRYGLPEYVRYRNEVRGHYALGGKPATTRLQEQNWYALPSVLERLERFARYPMGSTSVELNGCIRVLGRNGYIPNLRYRQKISLIETLDGLEAETEDGRVYLLRNYRKFRQVPSWHRDELPFRFNFEEYNEGHCPRIAVAL